MFIKYVLRELYDNIEANIRCLENLNVVSNSYIRYYEVITQRLHSRIQQKANFENHILRLRNC